MTVGSDRNTGAATELEDDPRISEDALEDTCGSMCDDKQKEVARPVNQRRGDGTIYT